MALYWALRLPRLLIRLLPLRLSYAIAQAAGTAAYYLWPGGRRRCVRNMLHVTGGDPQAARRLARRSMAYYATYLVDFFRIERITPADVTECIDFTDWPRIDRERTGRGIIFVTMHFGNWDLAGAAIANHGLPVTVVGDTFSSPRVDQMVVEARRHLGLRVIPASGLATGIMRALRRNDVVAMLIDVPRPQAGVEVQFFDATVSVPDGPARLALRTGAPIMVGGVWRAGPTSARYHADVERVAFEASGDGEADVPALTQATMRSLERLIRRSPEQWYIFRNLWVEDRAAEDAA